MAEKHTKCLICGCDKDVAEIAIRLGYRSDIAFAKLKQAHESFESIWDSVTDILSQEQIERIERLHKSDFDNLFMN
jgi:molecular chaperone GrpE (heat shock protein)